jgi:non-specific serine/threonine protein kinase
MIGKTVSHYKIIEKLGEGGMGEVYLAKDTKLKRQVAIKFLPEHLTKDKENVERFQREAEATAALNHPNIVTIHDVIEEDGHLCIVMEYIEGKSLRDVINEYNLEQDKIVEIISQLSEGLSKAHNAGIVHRDIKPENIIIDQDARVKILDFGLAKLKGVSKLTKDSSTLGTVHYMSPEQLRGSDIDHRSDIWSLGVVFYEMLTGAKPFTGEFDQAVMYSIMNEEYENVQKTVKDIPDKIVNISERCLDKNRNKRYQRIEDLLLDLREHPETSPMGVEFKTEKKKYFKYAISIIVIVLIGFFIYSKLLDSDTDPDMSRKMIAVLPFDNLGAEDDTYFSDGMTDAIIARLGMINNLGVISRHSSMQFRDTNKNIEQIGSELKVEYVLEGTVQRQKINRSKDKVRIIPLLIRVNDDTQIWSDIYEIELDDIFETQSQISEMVAQALDITILEPERKLLVSTLTDHMDAYEFLLRGNEYLNRGWDENDINIALEMYSKAIELDSSFAQAYSMIARSHLVIYGEYYDRTRYRLNLVKKAIDKAFEINPELPEVLVSSGLYYYRLGQLDIALNNFKKAQSKEPANIEVITSLAFILRTQGKLDLAINELKNAVLLDPLDHMKLYQLAITQLVNHDYKDAEQSFDEVISKIPDWFAPYLYKSILYMSWQGSYEKVQKIMEEAADKIGMQELINKLMFVGAGSVFNLLDENFNQMMQNTSIETSGADSATYYFIKAERYDRLKNPELKRAYYDSARVILERNVRLEPNEPLFHSYLGIVYAGLGEKEKAVNECKISIGLLNPDEDMWDGPDYLWNLAIVYMMNEEYDNAIDQINKALKYPSIMSKTWIRAEKFWDPLWNYEKFKKIME